MTLRQASGIVSRNALMVIGVALVARASGRAARRRLARDLHDGAQQRLLALALRLKARERTFDGAAPELDELLESTADELKAAVREIRELAAGRPPLALREGGLATALAGLAERTPLPVAVAASATALPPKVESTAYFVVSEALTNVVKHARASRVAIGARHEDTSLLVEVTDDGVGGAGGLRSLAERAETCGGRLSVTSTTGAGTSVVAEIPCGS